MADRTCARCGRVFNLPCHLSRHKMRKTPCDPIIDPPAAAEPEGTCKYCGRGFATTISMYRHIRQNCKIANSAEGMDKLLERTLQQQLVIQAKEVAALRSQVGVLAEMLGKQQGALTTGPPPPSHGTVTITQQANQITNQAVSATIHIHPWDGDRRFHVAATDIAAAFAENPRLREYMGCGDHEQANPETAPPYVAELFMDLVRRGHADPAARNVHLNPRRADQALVHMKSGRWAVMSLAEAARHLFDGVAATVHSVALSDAEARELPQEARSALAMAGMLYEEEPEAYIARAKGPLAAHLSNMAPPKSLK